MSGARTEGIRVRESASLSPLLADRQEGTPRLVPTGTGTCLARGLPPRGSRCRLDLSALDAELEYAPEDMTIRVEAGFPLVRLQERLRRNGQWLPLAWTSMAGTLGGLIGADRRGPLAGGWGSIRDYLIGIRFVDGRGRDVRGGGRVVKNVAGYDLMKLLVGSLGEFGVVVEGTLRVLPLPAALGAVRAVGPDTALCRRSVIETALRWLPSALWRVKRPGEPEALAAFFAGSRERVAAQAHGVAADWGPGAEALSSSRAEALLAGIEGWTAEAERDLVWGGALPDRLAGAPLAAMFPEGEWVADLLAGHFWSRYPAGRTLPPAGGNGTLHRNRDTAPWGGSEAWGSDPAEEATIWSGLKTALDPRGLLVAGRLPGAV